ncbi:serine hydrolase domain-containing protein [Thalassomonas sp. RHCl1]|uniref:serine hydrolase domain-containing protein n=1 Tax=Thalassomonas sp. RHCl1 TaxID=2995320 RepID=UPI00248C3A2E|nr:serine hydrolase domain-containing protein [Thalassomonas sp. RHCl1]
MIVKQFIIGVAILVMVALVGCSQTKEELSVEITQQLEKNSKVHGIPAQALVIMHNQEVLYRNSVGVRDIENGLPVTNKSIFPIYSVSKLFASTLVLQLYESGQLDLAAPASKYVSTLPSSWRDIRVEQFLNHASGVPEYYGYKNGEYEFPRTIEEAFNRMKDKGLSFSPDTQMQYNQTNYLVIKAVLEAITDMSYYELVNKKIIKPLGLKETWFGLKEVPKEHLVSSYLPESGGGYLKNEVHFPEYAISHSDAYSSLDDLSKFMSSLAQGLLISQQSLVELWRPYRLSDGDEGYFSTGWDYNRAGGWHEVGHDGGTLVRVRILFQSSLDDHYIIVYLTNGNKDGVWSRTLVDSVQNYVMPGLFSRIPIN